MTYISAAQSNWLKLYFPRFTFQTIQNAVIMEIRIFHVRKLIPSFLLFILQISRYITVFCTMWPVFYLFVYF